MTAWEGLGDAYGSAAAVPELLAAAEPGSEVWEELWSRLCHQGSVYSASYAALPALAAAAERWPRETRNDALVLATGILASTDGPEAPATVRERHAEAVEVLRRLARDGVRLASDDTGFVYGSQALLATEGDSVWAERLHALADGELEVACPACGEGLVFDLEADPATVARWGPDAEAPSAVAPARASDLDPAEALVHQLAVETGRTVVAARLLGLFGAFTCPVCGTAGRTADAIAHERAAAAADDDW